MKQAILGILRDILTSSGYSITESYSSDLVANKDGQRAVIRYGLSPDYEDIGNFADNVSNDTGLYVTTDSITDELYQYAMDNGVLVWDRDELAIQIGRAVIEDIEGNPGSLELIKPTFQEPEVQDSTLYGSFRKNSNYEPEPVQESMWSDIPAQQAEPITADSITVTLHSAPLKLTKEQVASIARPHIGNVTDMVLKFVPFWRYKYSLNTEKRYRSKIIDISGDGVGCINALNGNNENFQINEVQDQVDVPEDDFDVKTQIITQEEVQDDLMKTIIEEHTKDLRFDNTVGDAIISEHKVFKPSKDDINLEIEMVYIPIWEAKGNRNSIEINGYSSEILTAPADDDVEFI